MQSVKFNYDTHFKIFIGALVLLFWYDGLLLWPRLEILFQFQEGLNDPMNALFWIPTKYLPSLTQGWLLKTAMAIKLTAALLLCFPRTRAVSATLIILVEIYFRSLNSYINSPEVGFITWLLLMLILFPSNMGIFRKNDPKTPWIPREIIIATFVMASCAYGLSGFFKAMSPNWQTGVKFIQLIQNSHLVLPWVKITDLPVLHPFYKGLAWFVVLLETTAIVTLNLPKRYSQWFNLALLLMHLFLVFSFDLIHISIGMVVFHFFLIDPNYWTSLKLRRKTP